MVFMCEIKNEYVIPVDTTIAYLMREIIAPKIPEDLWKMVEEFAYHRKPHSPRAMFLEDFGFLRNKRAPKRPLIRYIEASDYDAVREEIANGNHYYPLNTVVKYAKKPWMVHLLLHRGKRVYPPRVYQRALEYFAYQGEDKLVNEMMGVYGDYISKKSVYQALIQMQQGIKDRQNALEQSHQCIQRILANQLKIPLEILLRTIDWIEYPKVK